MEVWHDGLLTWTCAWSLLWLCCWVAWWKSSTSDPRKVRSSACIPLTGQGLRFTSLPTMVTFKMLKKAAEDNLSTVTDDETWLWLRRVEATGLPVVEVRLVATQLVEYNLLGEGSYGKVYQIQLADINFPICLKLAKGMRGRERNLIECEMLGHLQDVRGVPRVLGVSLQPDAFIMTMHGHCTLASWLRLRGSVPPEETMLGVLRDLCGVLAHIHRRRLCHNDIKMNNVMVERGNGGNFIVTLIDFGVMAPYGRFPFGCVQRRNIKPFYDPEMMRLERTCSEATDMYSMGFLIHIMLFCFPRMEKRLRNICARAQGPANQRPTFAELENVFKKTLLG